MLMQQLYLDTVQPPAPLRCGDVREAYVGIAAAYLGLAMASLVIERIAALIL